MQSYNNNDYCISLIAKKHGQAIPDRHHLIVFTLRLWSSGGRKKLQIQKENEMLSKGEMRAPYVLVPSTAVDMRILNVTVAVFVWTIAGPTTPPPVVAPSLLLTPTHHRIFPSSASVVVWSN
ncbi:hypothetical protein ABFS82_11G020100 [Erythranthe guttata]